jgi:hypothetical protein
MKKLFLVQTVALAVAAISSWAESPYTQNIVGYVNVTSPGSNAYSQIGSPFQLDSNMVKAFEKTINKGDKVHEWSGSNFCTLTFAGTNFDGLGHAWIDSQGKASDFPLKNRYGAFVYQNNGASITNTFVGVVPQTNSFTIPAKHTYSLLKSAIPISAAIDSPAINLPLHKDDMVLIWSGDHYNTFIYEGANFDGQDHAFVDGRGHAQLTPVLQVGQAFLYQNNQESDEIWNQSLKL